MTDPENPGHLFTLSPAQAGVVSLSVALSFPLPGLRVTEHLALWSSDFPPDPVLSQDQATTCSASAGSDFTG